MVSGQWSVVSGQGKSQLSGEGLDVVYATDTHAAHTKERQVSMELHEDETWLGLGLES